MIRHPNQLPPPVVILGMHRSGTSMLAARLQECGLFIGRELTHHFESPYFLGINRRFLSGSGASWTEPHPYRERREEPLFHRESVARVETTLRQSFEAKFLDRSRQRAVRAGGPAPWGWKDPRTCLTAAVWRELFPQARWLHIVRHPLDVAISLRRRDLQRQRDGKRSFPTSLDLAHNLRLWEAYVADARRMAAGGAPFLEVRYEDLVQDPEAQLPPILRFCGLAADPAAVSAAAGAIDGARTQRFDAEEYRPWRAAAAALPLAQAFGYS